MNTTTLLSGLMLPDGTIRCRPPIPRSAEEREAADQLMRETVLAPRRVEGDDDGA